MCGIVGAIAERNVAEILLTGLQRLEYRGYDSAGLAVLSPENKISRLRVKGKVAELIAAAHESPQSGTTGIAHTRWATHGVPSLQNAHPHVSRDKIALVHNGIIENFSSLKQRLIQQGHFFTSETDTEVIVHLFHDHYEEQQDILAAARATANELVGAFALGVVHLATPDYLIAIRQGSPLVLGLGIGENFIASDQLALLPVTQRFIYLEEGDIALVAKDHIKIFDKENQLSERKIIVSQAQGDAANKAGFRHYMLKEIMEQPYALRATLENRLNNDSVIIESFGHAAADLLAETQEIHIVACGTSYHTGLIASYWLESIAKIPCRVFVASEYRYHDVPVHEKTLFISISQSGETADTLAALARAKEKNYLTHLAICNVPQSSLIRGSALSILTRAGVEIGVASTKAFTTQLAVMFLVTTAFVQIKAKASDLVKELVQEIRLLPNAVEQLLEINEQIKSLANSFIDKHHTLFIGRGAHYPIAMEGALKLKEISYIHAEAYPAGELKHGPLALVDADMPVIALIPKDDLVEKINSNLQEIHARGGQLFVFADSRLQFHSVPALHVIPLPPCSPRLSPICYTIPMQLLAYHVAVLRGTDVDQPRNLAKSVTVE